MTAAELEGDFATVEPPEAVEITLTDESSRVVAHIGEERVDVESPAEEIPAAFAGRSPVPSFT